MKEETKQRLDNELSWRDDAVCCDLEAALFRVLLISRRRVLDDDIMVALCSPISTTTLSRKVDKASPSGPVRSGPFAEENL